MAPPSASGLAPTADDNGDGGYWSKRTARVRLSAPFVEPVFLDLAGTRVSRTRVTAGGQGNLATAIALYRAAPDEQFEVASIDFPNHEMAVKTETGGVRRLNPSLFDIQTTEHSFTLIDGAQQHEIEFLDTAETMKRHADVVGGAVVTALMLATTAAAAGAGAAAVNHSRNKRSQALADRKFPELYDFLDARGRTFARPRFLRPANLFRLFGAALMLFVAGFAAFAVVGALVLLGMALPASSVAAHFSAGRSFRAIVQIPVVVGLGLLSISMLSFTSLDLARQFLSWIWAQVWFNPAEKVRRLAKELEDPWSFFFRLRPRVLLAATPFVSSAVLAGELSGNPERIDAGLWSGLAPIAIFSAMSLTLLTSTWIVLRDKPWRPGPSWSTATYRTSANSLQRWENGTQYLAVWVVTSIALIVIGLLMA